MMKLASHPRFWPIVGLLFIDSLVFSFTNPRNTPSFMLIIGFLLFAVTLYCLILGLLKAAGWYGLSFGGRPSRFARIAAGLLGGLVALQSIGELSLFDVLVLLPLAVLAYLYISYGQTRQSSSA